MAVGSLLAENNYLFVQSFISEDEAFALDKKFEAAKSEGLLQMGDTQAPRSAVVYGFLPFVNLLVRKVPHVSFLANTDVLPTYCYSRIYSNAEVLTRHRDRDACEISVTLNLAQDADWPIWIQKPNGEEVSLLMRPGDAMLYLGCAADHWRDAFTGTKYSQVFLHYVDSNGPKAYAYFDKERRQ